MAARRLFLIQSAVPDAEGVAVSIAGDEILRGLLAHGCEVTLQLIFATAHPPTMSDREARLLESLRQSGVRVLPPLFEATVNTAESAPGWWGYLHRVFRRFCWTAAHYPSVAFQRTIRERVSASDADLVLIHASSEGLAATFGLRSVPKVAHGGTPDHWSAEARLRHPALFGIPAASWSQRLRLLVEWVLIWRVRQQSLRFLRDCRTVVMADHRAARYYAALGHPRARYVPPVWPDRGASRERFGYTRSRRPEEPFRIVGNVGQMDATGVTFGLAYLGEVLPRLEQRLGADGFEVHLFGRGAPRPAVATALRRPQVRFRGYADDLDHEIITADVFLMLNNAGALRIGHNRLLHAWSLGACVIAHRHDDECIPEIRHGENALLGGSPEEVAEWLTRVACDDALRRRIGEGGRRTFLARFTAPAVIPQLVAHLEWAVCIGRAAPPSGGGDAGRRKTVTRILRQFASAPLRRLSSAVGQGYDWSAHAAEFKRFVPSRIRRWLRVFVAGLAIRSQVASRVDAKTILLADFPRCGVGWIRFAMATVLHYHETGEFRKLTHDEMYRYAPTLTGQEKVYRPYHFNGRDNLLKTHYDFHPRFRRAIIIYRNPFDAIRSVYTLDHMEGNGNPYQPLGSLSADESYLVERAREYLRFHESWLVPIVASPDRYLVIKYEEMLELTGEILKACFDFLKIDVSTLPPDGMVRLAAMYGRTDVTRPFMLQRIELDEAVRRKREMFQAIQPLMAPEAMRRIDPGLAAQLKEVVAKMDAVRWRAEQFAGAGVNGG